MSEMVVYLSGAPEDVRGMLEGLAGPSLAFAAPAAPVGMTEDAAAAIEVLQARVRVIEGENEGLRKELGRREEDRDRAIARANECSRDRFAMEEKLASALEQSDRLNADLARERDLVLAPRVDLAKATKENVKAKLSAETAQADWDKDRADLLGEIRAIAAGRDAAVAQSNLLDNELSAAEDERDALRAELDGMNRVAAKAAPEPAEKMDVVEQPATAPAARPALAQPAQGSLVRVDRRTNRISNSAGVGRVLPAGGPFLTVLEGLADGQFHDKAKFVGKQGFVSAEALMRIVEMRKKDLAAIGLLIQKNGSSLRLVEATP